LIHVGEWLASRTPAPPKELANRLSALVGGETCADTTEMAELMLRRAAALLETLCDDRSGAFDLLVADALITYAMEAAADDHDRFDELTARAAAMIAGASRGGQR